MGGLVERYRRLVPVVLFAAFVVLFAWSLRQAWTHTESDFPSYYAAAHLVLKKEPLREFYDMAHFQQEMDSFIVPSLLGGYIPQTPLTMLPFVPVANLAIGTAKQVWLIADVGLLGGTVWLLTRMTSLGFSGVLGLFVLGFGSLHTNLLLGQYYLLILFLLTAAVYLLDRGRDFFAGAVLGFICSVKLITAPFLLYFIAKKQPRAAFGMCAAIALSIATAISLFGWSDVLYYGQQILPRSVSGETLDPFNPATGTLTTLLRRLFVWEPELNPSATLNSPGLFFFLRPLLEFSVLWIALFAFTRTKTTTLGYAGFLIAVILMSPNTASYTFVLLLLPVALLVEHSTLPQKLPLLLCYLLVAIPNYGSWRWLFPKVWILIAMFSLALVLSGRVLRGRVFVGGVSAVAVVSLFLAGLDTAAYGREAHQRWKRIAVERGAIYSSLPIPFEDGILYQSIKNGRYMLRLHLPDAVRDFDIGANAFRPVAASTRNLISFESVRFGANSQFLLDLRTGIVLFSSQKRMIQAPDSSRSPDGRWVVCERHLSGSTQIYLIDQTQERREIQITDGRCNSFAPAWESDSQSIVFASDCGRGVGLPALYRAPLPEMLAARSK
ncbi:MAG: glycosyltransferase 87 family protein [Bryobacteraceae bacterium]